MNKSKELFERAQLLYWRSKFSSPRIPIGWRYTRIFPVCQRIYNYRCRWKRLYRLYWFLGANDNGIATPPVIDALKSATDNTTSFGAPTAIETEVAELICEMVPAVEKVRMVNSGTEACMSAIRVARGYTGREKFIKLEGCYYHGADAFLIKVGSGAVTLGVPNSPGVTKGTAQDTLLAPYNDLAAVEKIILKTKTKQLLLFLSQ